MLSFLLRFFFTQNKGEGAVPPGSSPRSTTTELSNGSFVSERNSQETVSKIDRARYDWSAIYTWRNETI